MPRRCSRSRAPIDPIGALDTSAVHVAGVVLFARRAGRHARRPGGEGASWRVGVDPGERTALVTDGPFALVRNPVFAALLPAAAGLALMVPSPIALAALAALVVAVELQVRVVEEPHLLRAHGPAYRAYAARVGRFAPGVGRLQPLRPEQEAVDA